MITGSTLSTSTFSGALTIHPNNTGATYYEETSDPNTVQKVATSEIEISQLVDSFTALRAEFQALPDWEKTVPDQETLDFWNGEKEILHYDQVQQILIGAQDLKDKIDPIRVSGLFPTQYEDEYIQLINFINKYGS